MLAVVLAVVVGTGVWAVTRTVSGTTAAPATSASTSVQPTDQGSVAPRSTVRALPSGAGGAPGTWVLADPGSVTSASTTIAILVTRFSCSGGVTGTVLTPAYELTDAAVILRTDVAPLPSTGAYTCQGNDQVPITVVLPEPIGTRALVDWVCSQKAGASTSFCFDKGVRRA